MRAAQSETKKKKGEERSAALSWTCASGAKHWLRLRVTTEEVTMKAVSYLVEKEEGEEELRALCQMRARSFHHHWQHRATAESGTRVTNPTKDSGGGDKDVSGDDSCHQTKRTRWKARR